MKFYKQFPITTHKTMHFRIPGFMTLLYRNMYIDEIRWDNEMDTQFQYVK